MLYNSGMQREDSEKHVQDVENKFKVLKNVLDERARRVWAALEARAIGYGGQSIVSKATGISRTTILSELKILAQGKLASHSRIRAPGGGRKHLIKTDKRLIKDLEVLVEATTRGDPESPLRWTCKSTRQIAAVLQEEGHTIERQTVASLLNTLGYSLQANQKTREGSSHPDRDAQFHWINRRVKYFQRHGWPVISVDAKKKERVGDFKNAGQEWEKQGEPQEVRVYDFVDKVLGKVNPYGVYDIQKNTGWVSVGTDHDTAEFAVETIHRWWKKMGSLVYPQAPCLLITADGGGSNGYRTRLWKVALQKLANDTGLAIWICHFPPGTSKWNKIEHRMFSHISMNWRAKPLVSHEVIVNLIAATSTRKGLKIEAELDTNIYKTGLKVTDEELNAVKIKKLAFHGEWNYIIAAQ
jgi:hypothetical protein